MKSITCKRNLIMQKKMRLDLLKSDQFETVFNIFLESTRALVVLKNKCILSLFLLYQCKNCLEYKMVDETITPNDLYKSMDPFRGKLFRKQVDGIMYRCDCQKPQLYVGYVIIAPIDRPTSIVIKKKGEKTINKEALKELKPKDSVIVAAKNIKGDKFSTILDLIKRDKKIIELKDVEKEESEFMNLDFFLKPIFNLIF